MALNNCRIWIMFICLLSLGTLFQSCCDDNFNSTELLKNDPQNCTTRNVTFLVKVNDSNLFIADNFTEGFCYNSKLGLILLVKNETFLENKPWKNEKIMQKMPIVESSGDLLLKKWHFKKTLSIYRMEGTNCTSLVNQIHGQCSSQKVNSSDTCNMTCWETKAACNMAPYDQATCNDRSSSINDSYIMTSTGCINCNNPVKKPQKKADLNEILDNINPNHSSDATEPLDSAIAEKVMSSMTAEFVNQFNESTVALTMGESITGVLMRQTDPKNTEEVSFGYTRINESFSILEERQILNRFSRSITVSKEAFDKAISLNISEPFVAVFRFVNMSKDENNSTVMGDEVLAIEMGTSIRNLTDKININFWNLDYKGIPECYSWNGNGNRPNWTIDGCHTNITGINITCSCTHMTFFAVLLTPLNETISSSTLDILTTITRVGCGISMFFLGVVLFIHFVMRRASSSNFTNMLIHLVLAMFLLVFSFLVNDLVAKTKNVVGCTIMAASMHYFMLSTFTWFAVHAFHLCLQLYSGGKIKIQHYLLKVSIFSWVMPAIITIILLSVGKYGEMTINTESTATSVSMCWILDNNVHYIVNIGYYALVFLFTFSTLVLMLTWLYCVKQSQKAGAQQKNTTSCQKILTIMGLCCMLGVTWSCAFFAYGIFRIPAYYCFTVLNSFQGFCLFIYYYKTSSMVENRDPHSTSSTSSSTTLKTNLDEIFNPYVNNSSKPKPE